MKKEIVLFLLCFDIDVLSDFSCIVPNLRLIYHKYSDSQDWTNSVNPDQTLQHTGSDEDLYCLPLIQQFLDTSATNSMDFLRV